MAPNRQRHPRTLNARHQAWSPRQILQEPLPPLQMGPLMTRSSAIHRTASVRQTVDCRQWMDVLVPHVQTSEYVHVADEHGVQGRFQERVGQVLSHISHNHPLSFAFGDSKCAPSTTSKTPDFIVMDGAGRSIVVDEIKTLWIEEHQIMRIVHYWEINGDDDELLNLLGDTLGLAVFTGGFELIQF
ncbi:hypothetical protein N7535_007187 [Penicillium sp. DV-2018c]|nr:hypothetical protein N7461_003211 [Penicillium sp. DV-2018c]KAJ5565549.1 hypothetical protein N7535_007187 [Penicillium sp. DV-2018c]